MSDMWPEITPENIKVIEVLQRYKKGQITLDQATAMIQNVYQPPVVGFICKD